MKQSVVQIGAGAIGRGFLGQLWCEGGHETVFVDVSAPLVAEINRRGSYPLRLVTGVADETRTVAPVRAILASDTEKVIAELAGCAFAATAVGARHIEEVAQTLLGPVSGRRAQPLNVLLCENGSSVRDKFLNGFHGATANIHVVETVVGRMVPESGLWETDPLAVTTESYQELPFNRSQWAGDAPDIPGLVPVAAGEFHAYELRKLFLHNGGHALLAYHGYLSGRETIRECAEDDSLVAELRGFWAEVCAAFRRSDDRDAAVFAPGLLGDFTEDLLNRFRNPHLGDTVLRVARDPLRKLAAGERLAGTATFCLANGVLPRFTIRAIAAALRFDPPGDPGASVLQRSLVEDEIGSTISRHTGIEAGSELMLSIVEEFANSGRR